MLLNPSFRQFISSQAMGLFANNKVINGAIRGGSRTAATSKMEHFVIIVNGWKPLTIITKSSILGLATVLDPPLAIELFFKKTRKLTGSKAEGTQVHYFENF